MTQPEDAVSTQGLGCTISALSIPGSPGKTNEDAYGIKCLDRGWLVGVFDGLTTLTAEPYAEAESGAMVARFLKRELEATSDVEAGELRSLLIEWNSKLEAFLKQRGWSADFAPDAKPASSATLCLIDVECERVDFAHVYDSFAMALLKNGASQRITSDRNKRFDEEVLHLMWRVASERSISVREARSDARVLQALRRSRIEKLNRTDGAGVGVVNGDPRFEQYIETVSLPWANVSAVLLGTDGLLPLNWDTGSQEDRVRLFALARSTGLGALIREKQASEALDRTWQQLRFKDSDDATAVLIEQMWESVASQVA